MWPTAVLASALVRPATVLTAICSSRRWLGTSCKEDSLGMSLDSGAARTSSKRDAEVTLPTIDPEPTMVVECVSCRPSCWLLGRARPSSVEGGRGAGKGLNPLSSGAGGSGGGGTTVKGGGTGECAEAVAATILCRSPRAIDSRPQAPSVRPGDMFTHLWAHLSAAAGPVRVQRESTSERDMGQHLGRGLRHARHSELGQATALARSRQHPRVQDRVRRVSRTRRRAFFWRNTITITNYLGNKIGAWKSGNSKTNKSRQG
jgi:hypothetical protein